MNENSLSVEPFEGSFPVFLDLSDISIARRHDAEGKVYLYISLRSGNEDYIEMDEEILLHTLKTVAATRGSKTLNSSLEKEVFYIATTKGKIQAIKFYRDQTGAGLKDSKDYVEEMVPRLGGTFK